MDIISDGINSKCMYENCDHYAQVRIPTKINNESVDLYLCNEHFEKIRFIEPRSVSMEVKV